MSATGEVVTDKIQQNIVYYRWPGYSTEWLGMHYLRKWISIVSMASCTIPWMKMPMSENVVVCRISSGRLSHQLGNLNFKFYRCPDREYYADARWSRWWTWLDYRVSFYRSSWESASVFYAAFFYHPFSPVRVLVYNSGFMNVTFIAFLPGIFLVPILNIEWHFLMEWQHITTVNTYS
jgi:hypothetical protein